MANNRRPAVDGGERFSGRQRPIDRGESSVKGEQALEFFRMLTLRQLRYSDPVPNPQRNISSAADLVGDILKEVELKEGYDEDALREAWRSIAGEYVAKYCQPHSLQNGVLILKVLQPAIRFQLEQMKGKLLRNLHEEMGKEMVKSVRFVLG